MLIGVWFKVTGLTIGAGETVACGVNCAGVRFKVCDRDRDLDEGILEDCGGEVEEEGDDENGEG